MIEGFESEIHNKTNGKVKIEKKIHTGTVISNIKSGDDQDAPEIGISDGPPQQVWVERMEDFRRSMISIYRALNNRIEIPRVKARMTYDLKPLTPSLSICTPIIYIQNIATYIFLLGRVNRRRCRSSKSGDV